VKSLPRRLPFCGILLGLLLAGCSGSNEVLDGSHGRSVTAEVRGVLQQVVLPTVEKLAAFSPVTQPTVPRSGSREPGVPDCSRLDSLCRHGGFEVCNAAPGGPVAFRYDRCARPVGLVDGAWELAQDGVLATAEFDLSLDDLTLSGRIDYVVDDICWRKEFDSFAARGLDYAAIVDGTVDYCLASGARNGRLEISVTGPSDRFDLRLDFEAADGTALVIHDAGTAVCRFDPRDGAAECETD
jgi:hypothetical protein